MINNNLFHNNRGTLRSVFVIVTILIITTLICSKFQMKNNQISVLAQEKDKVKTVVIEKEVVVDKGNKIDELVDVYAKRFSYGSVDKYSELKATLHCLLYYESKHTNANGKGDNGLASGPLQFHQETYVAFRKQMMSKKIVNYIGDRDNLEDAVMTTAWALSEGKGKNWGPILRGECINP